MIGKVNQLLNRIGIKQLRQNQSDIIQLFSAIFTIESVIIDALLSESESDIDWKVSL